MKTIGDFKAAGLVISENDSIDGVAYDKTSNEFKISVFINKGFRMQYAWTIREFAWRKNTGEKPEFKGMIEWLSTVGTLHQANMLDFTWLRDVDKWRPLLNQTIPTETPEEKEALDAMFGELSGEPGKLNPLMCKTYMSVSDLIHGQCYSFEYYDKEFNGCYDETRNSFLTAFCTANAMKCTKIKQLK